MSDELKPCPFCGGDAGIDSIYIVCMKCGATTSGAFETYEEIVSAWNKRTPDGGDVAGKYGTCAIDKEMPKKI